MIRGRFVTLRPFHADDLPALRRWFDDESVMRFWARPRPIVLHDQFQQDMAGRFGRFDDAGYFTILDPRSRPIGRIGFERVDDRTRSAEVQILIGEPDALGRGYGRDAMEALLTYLFLGRSLHRVELTVLADNHRAIRSYEAIGFRHEGRLRGCRYLDGAHVDELMMSMLRPEFEARVSKTASNCRDVSR